MVFDTPAIDLRRPKSNKQEPAKPAATQKIILDTPKIVLDTPNPEKKNLQSWRRRNKWFVKPQRAILDTPNPKKRTCKAGGDALLFFSIKCLAINRWSHRFLVFLQKCRFPQQNQNSQKFKNRESIYVFMWFSAVFEQERNPGAECQGNIPLRVFVSWLRYWALPCGGGKTDSRLKYP